MDFSAAGDFFVLCYCKTALFPGVGKQTESSIQNRDLVNRYLRTKTGVRPDTKMNYGFVCNLLKKESFAERKIRHVKRSDAKLFLIKLQEDGKGYSTIHNVRGVLRPAFQMAVDDEMLRSNPFSFPLVNVVVNDSVMRQAVTPKQMRAFLKFVHDSGCYGKYYEVFYILFHTGMRISEFCGLTIRDLDMENRIIDINHQMQRTSAMEYVIEKTKTNAGTRKIPMTDDVCRYSGRPAGACGRTNHRWPHGVPVL